VDCLSIVTDLVATGLAPVPARMRAAAREGHATATDLADYLVRKGLPFRDAHEVVARAVRAAEGAGKDLADLPIDDLRAFADAIDDDVYAVLTLEGSVASRDHEGGTAPSRVRAAAEAALAALAAEASGATPRATSRSSALASWAIRWRGTWRAPAIASPSTTAMATRRRNGSRRTAASRRRRRRPPRAAPRS